MNRCVGVIENACVSELSKLIRVAGSIETDRLTFTSSLKYAIINDPSLSVQIRSENSFEVFENSAGAVRYDSPALASARISDFFLGSARVKRQYDTLLKAKDASVSSAWLLVTAYYCSFFASIEISKLFGRISTSLSEVDLQMLANKATGTQHAAFFQNRPMNFIGHSSVGKLLFQSVGTRPHVAAWQNARHAIREAFQGLDWKDAKYYLNVLTDQKYSPSEIRNEWNYRKSDYFGLTGERRASSFKKLVGNPGAAHALLLQRKGLLEDLDPCVIAILCELLSVIIKGSHDRASLIIKTGDT